MPPILFLLAAGVAPPDVAQPRQACTPDATQNCTIQLSAAQMFAIADRLAAEKRFDEAADVLRAITQDKDAPVRAEARVRLARLSILKGDLWGGARWYQQLLEEMPDAAAVRIELAQLLVRLGDEPAASRQLRLAEASGLPDAVSRSLRRATEFLKTKSPISFDLSLGFAPDTNINAATNVEAVDAQGYSFKLNDDGKARSGIGLTYFTQFSWRRPINPSTRWITQLRSDGNLYRTSQFNSIGISADSGPELTYGAVTLWPSFGVGRRYYLAHRLYDYYGPSVSATIRQGKRGQIAVGASFIKMDYAPIYGQRSGTVLSGRIGYDRALSPRMVVHGGLMASRATAQDGSTAMRSISADLAMRRDIGPFSLVAQTLVRRSRAADIDPFFLALRRDHTYEGSLGVIVRRISWHGLSPQVKATYTRNDSSLRLYEYRRLRTEFTLTGTF